MRLEAESPTEGRWGPLPCFFFNGIFERRNPRVISASLGQGKSCQSQSSVAQVSRRGLLLISFRHAKHLGKDSKIHRQLLISKSPASISREPVWWLQCHVGQDRCEDFIRRMRGVLFLFRAAFTLTRWSQGLAILALQLGVACCRTNVVSHKMSPCKWRFLNQKLFADCKQDKHPNDATILQEFIVIMVFAQVHLSSALRGGQAMWPSLLKADHNLEFAQSRLVFQLGVACCRTNVAPRSSGSAKRRVHVPEDLLIRSCRRLQAA